MPDNSTPAAPASTPATPVAPAVSAAPANPTTNPPITTATGAATPPPLHPDQHPRWHWLLARSGHIGTGVVVLAAAAWFGPDLVLGPRVELLSVRQGDLVQTVVASGRVAAPHRVSVGVQITGTVADVPVQEGQTVASGDVLIRLNDTELQATLLQARLNSAQADARLRSLQALQAPLAAQAVLQASATHTQMQRTLLRSRELVAQGFIGQAALDDSLRAERVAAAQLDITQRQWASALPAGTDHQLALTTLALARAGDDAARARLAYAVVRAPASGVLIARAVEPGDVVQPGKVLMLLSPAGSTELVVQIDERNLRLMRTGLTALASADAYPNERFDARLVFINPGVDAERGAVEVKLAVPRPPPTLAQDMTVSVDIEVARRTNAVLIPTAAVHGADTATPWVLRLEGRHARRVAVVPGLRSGSQLQALPGPVGSNDSKDSNNNSSSAAPLKAGDQLVPVATASIVAGQRLRAAGPASAASSAASAASAVVKTPTQPAAP
ncbi:MAG: efflux transporter periplasmic adaptor subunit [Burkholderiales bacterium PBB6]|nr:MAG: efflux transporter periplasmic adaptor subunit [Burkholderiales bacterium PBB6]